MPESVNPRPSKLPLLVVQHELQKIVLELYAIDFKLAHFQDAIGLEPDKLPKDGGAGYQDSRAVNIWASIERARDGIGDFAIPRLTHASRLPENYPMPYDAGMRLSRIKTDERAVHRRTLRKHILRDERERRRKKD